MGSERTTKISKISCYNRVKMKNSIRWGISSYILDPNTKTVALKCVSEMIISSMDVLLSLNNSISR